MTKRNGQKIPKVSELVIDAADGAGSYWVNIGLVSWDEGLDIESTWRKLLAEKRTVKLTYGGKRFVLLSEVEAEKYRRLAAGILEGKRYA